MAPANATSEQISTNSLAAGPSSKAEVDPENDPNHSRNFGLGVLYMVFMRIGWIFKTESVIMPAVLDVIGGSGWLRGCLPMLNRFGQSIPPLLVSDRVKNSKFKKFGLFSTTTLMGVCFLGLSVVWLLTGGQTTRWLPFVFLLFYGIFFVGTGINLLILNTITGKLIRVTRRGLLSLVGTVIGAVIAVTCAWFLLHAWLDDSSAGSHSNFAAIFAFTGGTFFAAAVSTLFLKERPDHREPTTRTFGELFRGAWLTIKLNRNFRRLALIGALFGVYLILFPHYQRLARDRLGLSLTALIPWVIAQNLGAAFFSIPSGWIADRFGNRLVLRIAMLILCIAPILSLVIASYPNAGKAWFTVVFCLLGLTPVAMRYLNNYVLEICPNLEHPKYLSSLNLAMSAPPMLLSPLLGAMVDWISFEFVFGVGIVATFIGWLLTFFLEEPRLQR